MRKYFLQKSEGAVFQEIKDSFNETPLVTRNCVKAINSLVHCLSIHKLSPDTINNILLFLLRSFQSEESYLKRIIYSCITELSKHTDQGFVSINILVKDLNSKLDDKKKTEVLKALFSVVPQEMVYDFEKYVTQALVSGNESREDVGVVVCYLLLSRGFGKVKGWVSNVDISNDIYGYHKLALLEKGNLISRYEKVWGCKEAPGVLAVRILADRLAQDSSAISYFKNFLNINLSSEEVFFEACKSVAKMKDELAIQFISQALQGLRVFLKSPTFSYKFASIRIVSLLSLRFAKNVSILNKEIEDLLSEDSKTISMLAISTLLKTGTEDTVDRLVLMLPEFMNEMDDNYKKISIDTLETLATIYRSKSSVFVNFLAKSMHERGALEFKLYLLEVFSRNITKDFLREKILDILCMYLEDSEHHQLSIEILGMLGREIPNASNPRKYLLHVYNRLILEDNKIRSAALQCLYNLSMSYDLSIGFSTIKNCINDSDRMVSGISKFLLSNLENKEKIVNEKDFDLEELGDLKEKVLEHMGCQEEEFVEKKAVTVSSLTKTCREILVSQDSSDIKIKLVKEIVEDRKILKFTFQNALEDVQVLSGKLSLTVGTNLLQIDIPTINPQETHSVEKEIEAEANDVINGVFDYELCVEDETESESTSLVPFMFSYFDLASPTDLLSRPSECKTVKFVLKKDLTSSSKKILDLLNLKILNQEIASNRLVMGLCGVYKSDILVEIDISYSKVSSCILNIYCDDLELLEILVGYFD
ncbi:putative coatomer subunit gamma [Nosema granulosis]|uniref:Coatomer subunit gamma n=1 Tax=Nosema granulosis TaxID=83296 RepID=A0A9P6KY01_9MICR|nr:putative coatomer subunit gamma [Nosema granulosis]